MFSQIKLCYSVILLFLHVVMSMLVSNNKKIFDTEISDALVEL